MAANLKEVRERIASVNNTQQITRAMKMVSAAKLRRAQQAIQNMRPYSNKLNEMLRNILSNLEGGADTVYSKERTPEKICLVIVTSNRGLCGAFNSNVIKAAIATMEEKYKAQYEAEEITLLPIGKRGYDYFRKRYKGPIIKDHVELFSDLSAENVSTVSKGLMEAFEEKEYDVVEVAYGQFKNAATQYPKTEQFLPVAKLEQEGEGKQLRADYIFEPGMEELLNYLVPSILQNQFHKFLLDTHASEHGARMTAMDKATENADELLRDLKISYNKARQEAITKEILEIVGGAAALESE